MRGQGPPMAIGDDAHRATEDEHENVHILIDVLVYVAARAKVDQVRFDLAQATQGPDHPVGGVARMQDVKSSRTKTSVFGPGLDHCSTAVANARGPTGGIAALVGHPGVLADP